MLYCSEAVGVMAAAVQFINAISTYPFVRQRAFTTANPDCVVGLTQDKICICVVMPAQAKV